MKKLKKRILEIAVLLTVVSSILPFFCNEVSAEAVGGSSPIIGVNITYIGYDGEVVPYQTTVHFDTEQTMWRCTSSHSTMGCQVWESENINGSTLDEITGTITTNATSTYTYRLYQYEFIFDKTYVGSITFNGNHPGATTTTTYYVNGDRLVLTDINLVTSFTIGSYSLIYAPLEVIDKIKQWNFPYESFNIVNYQFQVNRQYKGLTQYDFYTYPFYEITSGNTVFVQWCNTNQTYSLIMGTTFNIIASNSSNFLNISNRDGTSTASVNRVTELTYRTNGFKYVKIDFTVQTSADYYIKFVSNDNMFVPVYCGLSSNKYISTDFALRFGLSNQLLDDLHIIAQGTQSSNQSGSNLEDKTDDINDISDQMFQLEDSFNDDLQDNLQQINTNFDVGNQFGSKFLYSANWVRTQFNNLTNLNPFGSLLSFSLLLGIGLLIIGKVLG